MYSELINNINKYDNIVLYRHVNPDFDAFGSQIGLYLALKEMYKGKNIYLAGDTKGYAYSMFTDCYDFNLPDFEKNEVLGIVLDTANKERIDGDTFNDCHMLIKIDHHVIVDQYGDINIVNEKASSCSEIIGDFLLQHKSIFNISSEAAKSIYIGIVGDSNRFMYDTTNSKTFEVASYLMECGVSIKPIYQTMYKRSIDDLKIQGYILSKFIQKNKLAYYLLTDEDLIALGIDREKAANFVNIFSGLEEIEIWMAITENKEENNFRVRIRSKNIEINEVASKYQGGGHALASGATLNDINELKNLIEDLEEKING